MIEILDNYIKSLKENRAFDGTQFSENSEILEKIKELNQVIEQKFVSLEWADRRIDEFNHTILQYALNNFDAKVSMDESNDIFDSLAQAINLLGEELNYSIVSKCYYEDVLNSLNTMIVLVDDDELIFFCNKPLLSRLNYTMFELDSQSIFTILPDEETTQLILKNTLVEKKQVILTKEGDIVPVQYKKIPIITGDGLINGNIIVVKEIGKQYAF